MFWSIFFVFSSCAEEEKAAEGSESTDMNKSIEIEALQNELEELQAQLNALQESFNSSTNNSEQLESIEERLTTLESNSTASNEYTDEDAVAAIQNNDPWNQPTTANIQNLWSQTDYGYQFLENSRWTMDNRNNPPGADPRHELIQFFHETPECTESSTFADCNSTAAIKFYVNGPQIVDHDWSEAGWAAAAIRKYHTHASGIYLVSFGQLSYVSDYAYGLIPPSGIHLEPHGAHQALRIDGTGNSGENIRIDTTQGSKGIAIYASESQGLYCDTLGLDCTNNYPLYLRGGTLHFEDLQIERTATDARNAGVSTLHQSSLGIEHFYSWYNAPDTNIPVHCTWNTTVSENSIIKVQPYSTSPDLLQAHSYVIIDVWGPGNPPSNCTEVQNIKTDSTGVYGYSFPNSHIIEGGFSVAILGVNGSPLYPGDWQEADRPAFLYEVIDAL